MESTNYQSQRKGAKGSSRFFDYGDEWLNRSLRFIDNHTLIVSSAVLLVFFAGTVWGYMDASTISDNDLRPLFVKMFQEGVDYSGVPNTPVEMVNRHVLSFFMILKNSLITILMMVVGPFSLILNLFNGYFFGFEIESIMSMKRMGILPTLFQHPSILFKYGAFVLAAIIGNYFFIKAVYDYRLNGNIPDLFFLLKLFGLILFPLILLAAFFEGYISPLM